MSGITFKGDPTQGGPFADFFKKIEEDRKETYNDAAAQQGTTPMKKGGSVKGWGKARGARKAKVY